MKRNLWIAGLTAALSAGILFIAPQQVQAGVLPEGFSVSVPGGEESLDLSGMTAEEARGELEGYVNGMAEIPVSVAIDGNSFTASAGELGCHWENSGELGAAVDEYSGGNLLERFVHVKELEKNPPELSVKASLDDEKLAAFVNDNCAPYVREAADASIVRENGAFVITDEVTGLAVDMGATKAALDKALAEGLSGGVSVEAVVTETAPRIRRADLETITDVLGTFSTNFNAGSRSRTKNLVTGSGKINGAVLMPGDQFSAYEYLTPFTIENGYAPATSYENGRSVDSIGGGACQLTTTLYNAALRSELEIVQRQNHSMTVSYVNPSEDAAIAGTYKDLKFKNNYETPVYIEGTISGNTLTFTIYGKETRPANRTLEFVSETLGTIDPGAPTETVDNSLAPGARVKVSSGHIGKKSRLWKVVYVDGVETERSILHTDTYMASKSVYRVGPAAPAAPAVTEPTAPAETQPAETQPAETQPSGPAGEAFGPGSETAPVSPAAPAPDASAPAPDTSVPVSPAAPSQESAPQSPAAG